MAHDSDHLDDIPSIVPERDELVSHRKRKRGNSSTSAAYVQEVQASGTSGFVVFMLTLLFLGTAGSGAGGYYFYKENEASKANLEKALSRIVQLESNLNLVDEVTAEKATGLLERVDFNFSEIDKLWAARNTMRTETGEVKTGLTAAQATIKSMETAIANHASMLNENRTLVAGMQTRVDQINKNFSGMDNLGSQLTALNADLNRVKLAMDSVQGGVETRLNATEQDIESINIYRLQVNQTLAALQESINRLQTRVGQ